MNWVLLQTVSTVLIPYLSPPFRLPSPGYSQTKTKLVIPLRGPDEQLSGYTSALSMLPEMIQISKSEKGALNHILGHCRGSAGRKKHYLSRPVLFRDKPSIMMQSCSLGKQPYVPSPCQIVLIGWLDLRKTFSWPRTSDSLWPYWAIYMPDIISFEFGTGGEGGKSPIRKPHTVDLRWLKKSFWPMWYH